ncbi:ribosome maturation factor RimP [Aeromicrobium massiliense]|uniref:ribosome maturation factor RimP n=1 Tax=Aeromicrobium massiliense TaxID=1464554 RepID=UPI0002FFD3FE|nr:ribosome maturation factor RimP [Aeromicrobium massiliense]
MADTVENLVERCVADLGLDLEAVELAPAGKQRILRVAVDTDGGITIDHVAELTRALSRELDESDVMGDGAYTLEVTSRGVDRPLSLPRHWRRNAGRLVKATTAEGTKVVGRIGESDDEGVTLDVGGTPTRYAYDELTNPLVQVELNRK